VAPSPCTGEAPVAPSPCTGETPVAPGTRPTVEFLLGTLPEEQMAPFVHLAAVTPQYKLAVLLGYVAARQQLPPGCEALWEDADRGTGPGGRAAAPLLVSLCGRLDVPTLVAFYRNSAEEHADTLVKCLVEASEGPGVTGGALTQIVPAVDEQTWFALLQKHGVDFFRQYPQNEPALGETLQRILRALPEDLTSFSQRLDVILAGEHLLPEDSDQEAAAAWGRCRRAVLELGRLQEQRSCVSPAPGSAIGGRRAADGRVDRRGPPAGTVHRRPARSRQAGMFAPDRPEPSGRKTTAALRRLAIRGPLAEGRLAVRDEEMARGPFAQHARQGKTGPIRPWTR